MTNNASAGTRLSPPHLPVVAMTDLMRGWQPPYCLRCRSRMWVDVPTLGVPGCIACLMCCTTAATVLDRLPLPFARGDISRPRRGRPPKSDEEKAAGFARHQAEYRARLAAGQEQEPWSRYYAACTRCHQTDRPYHSRGLCDRCKMRNYRRDEVAV